jgi:hypothetical protein
MTVFRRRPGIASVTALAGITAALAAVHALAPGWARSAGLDVWNLAVVEAEYEALMVEGDELSARQGQLWHQIEAGEYLGSRLAAGRLPLSEAADEVLRVNHDRPGLFCVLRRDFPTARTDRELAARYAIAKAELLLRDDPARLARELARLEAEYRALTRGR